MNFLPENYTLPKGDSNYYKLEDGDNVFRVLSPATVGWKYWTDEKGEVLERPVKGCKSICVKTPQEAKQPARHFWAFVVYSYKSNAIHLYEITQMGIMEAIQQFILNPNWGDPQGYDLIVNKTGTGLDTKYQISVNPKVELDQGILKLYQDMQIDLQALFRGEDPFKAESAEVNPKAVK